MADALGKFKQFVNGLATIERRHKRFWFLKWFSDKSLAGYKWLQGICKKGPFLMMASFLLSSQKPLTPAVLDTKCYVCQ